MKAVIVEWDQMGNYETRVGQRIDVLGFVDQGPRGLAAVWADENGYVWTIGVRFIRMETQDDRNVARLHRYLGTPSSKPVNAVAGPQTLTPRGVR